MLARQFLAEGAVPCAVGCLAEPWTLSTRCQCHLPRWDNRNCLGTLPNVSQWAQNHPQSRTTGLGALFPELRHRGSSSPSSSGWDHHVWYRKALETQPFITWELLWRVSFSYLKSEPSGSACFCLVLVKPPSPLIIQVFLGQTYWVTDQPSRGWDSTWIQLL